MRVVQDFIARGVQFQVDGDILHIDAPPGLMTPEDLESLRSLKSEIVAHVRIAQGVDADAFAEMPEEIAQPVVLGVLESWSEEAHEHYVYRLGMATDDPVATPPEAVSIAFREAVAVDAGFEPVEAHGLLGAVLETFADDRPVRVDPATASTGSRGAGDDDYAVSAPPADARRVETIAPTRWSDLGDLPAGTVAYRIRPSQATPAARRTWQRHLDDGTRGALIWLRGRHRFIEHGRYREIK